MKNSLAIFFLIFVQFVCAQEEEAVLYFTDGTDLKGFGMIKSGTLGDKDVIKFRISSDSKADIWESDMVSSIVFVANGEREEFYYVKISKHSLNPRLLKVFSEGKVMLYGDIERKGRFSIGISGSTTKHVDKVYGSNQTPIVDFLISNPKRNKSSTNQNEEPKQVTFYVKRETEEYPTKLTGDFINWKKIAKEYFKDCDSIAQRIDDKTYKINNLVELVDVYNDDCLD